MEQRFIADGNVGKLARLLRMLGFDTLYDNAFTKIQVTEIALQEDRIVLSRNPAFGEPQAAVQSFVVTNENAYVQLQQVVHRFGIKEIRPFTRCIICNRVLQAVSKENILNLLQPNTVLYFNQFWQCSNCKRIYWKGSHYQRMQKLGEKIVAGNFN